MSADITPTAIIEDEFDFDFDEAKAVAFQRAGKAAKLAFTQSEDRFKNWPIGKGRDITDVMATYSDECMSIIKKVTTGVSMPSADRQKCNAAFAAFRKEMRILHGVNFELVGKYVDGARKYAVKRTA